MTIVEFEVSEQQQGLVLGRNGLSDIPLGFTFLSINKRLITGTRENIRSIEAGQVAAINLSLSQVHWYRRNIDSVPGGHTAGLRLHGEGLDQLQAALKTIKPGEYLYLTGPSDGAEPTVHPDRPETAEPSG